MNPAHRVAALYIDPRGPYPSMPDVDSWDEARDARLYDGPLPVVAHPPCGPWGHTRRLSLLQDKTLAIRAVEQVRQWGGLLEHPLGSTLWQHFDLPRPGELPDAHGGRTWRIEQVSWGHCCRKPTLLYAVRCDPMAMARTLREGGEPTHAISSRVKRRGRLAPSAGMRRRTPPDFARWLVDCAATATSPASRA